MASGVFAVARNIFEHPLFEDEAFTQREAWIWLIREAAWKDRRVRVGRKVCDLKRGQLATSMRFMADRWKWSEARVRRFINRLKNDAMVEVVSDALATQITICKYDIYQRVSLPSDALSDAVTDEPATQQRREQEDRENNLNTGKEPLRGAAPVMGEISEAEVFRFGKAMLGKSAGGVIANLKKVCGHDLRMAADYLRQASEKENPMEWLQKVIRASSPEAMAYRGVPGVEQFSVETPEDRRWKAQEKRIYAGVL
ncbi:hypothetical protein GCM10007908_33790 [Rhizobium albus]|nr:hypothetical protein GCM10007908_33790 [Rhizobium albus]